MKRLLSIITAIFLLSACVFTGACGKKKTVSYDPDNFLPEGTAENPYQIVKDPVTLKLFVPKSTMISSVADLVFFKELSRVTNIKFDIIEADVSAYTSLRTVMWENKKDLPDLLFMLNPVEEQNKYSKYGAIVRWNDPALEAGGIKVGSLIDNYMSNYKNLLENNFNTESRYSAKEIATLDDGYMYSPVCYNASTRDQTGYCMYINGKWIDRLNDDYSLNLTKDPQTIEEYLTILRAFKQYDANGNGNADDEIPCTSAALLNFRNFILQSYGYVSNWVEIENDQSGFVYVPATDAYREYLKVMQTMYSEKLLDNSTFEMTGGSSIAVKGYDNRIGSFPDAAAYLSVGYKYESDYIMIGPLSSEWYGNEQTYMLSHGPVFNPTAAVIPTGTPYVREIARLMDILYTDYGTMLFSFGVENENWHWNEDHTSYTFDIPADWTGTSEEYRATICPNVGIGGVFYNPYHICAALNDPVMTRETKLAERYENLIKNPIPDGLYLNDKDNNRVALLDEPLGLYVRSMEYNFITGKKDSFSDGDWNTYVNTLKGYGYEEIVEIYNNTWRSKQGK